MRNYWLDRVRRKQFEYQRKFLQALRSGGSIIVTDWDEVYRRSGLEKPSEYPASWNTDLDWDKKPE